MVIKIPRLPTERAVPVARPLTGSSALKTQPVKEPHVIPMTARRGLRIREPLAAQFVSPKLPKIIPLKKVQPIEPNRPARVEIPKRPMLVKRCSVCQHKERRTIDLELVARSPLRSIADRYGLSKSSLDRHVEHIPTNLIQARRARYIADADFLLAEIVRLQQETKKLLCEARLAQSRRTALGAIRLLVHICEVLAKLVRPQMGPSNATTRESEPSALLAAVLRALPDDPDIRAKFAEKISPIKSAA